MNLDVAPWNYIDAERVQALHAAEMQRGGVQWGPPREGCVEGSIGSAMTAALYSADDEPDLITAAAHLLFKIAKNHCFTDGNKRAAFLAVVDVFASNGLRIVADQTDAASLVENVADDTYDVFKVIEWLGKPERLQALTVAEVTLLSLSETMPIGIVSR